MNLFLVICRCNLVFFVCALVAANCYALPSDKNHRILSGDPGNVRNDFGLVDGTTSNGALLYVPDVKNQALYAFNTKDGTWKKLSEGTGYSGTFFQLGHLYLADNRGAAIHRSRPYGKPELFAKFEDEARPNDLVVDKSGNVYATFTKEGQIRRIGANGDVQTVASGLERPNGITMTPDGSALYVSEVNTGKIFKALLNETGEVSELSVFATLPMAPEGAKADGMCIDRAGNVYCTGFESVRIFDPSGKQIDEIKTERRPINCAFGGPHNKTLYISTFGGLVKVAANAYGVASNPPTSGPLSSSKGKPSTAIPGHLEADLNVVYYKEANRKLLCDLIRPQEKVANRAGIVLVHGGGWLHGDKTKFRPLAIKLANAGYFVMSIEYRLGYEAKFPAGIRDCNAATMFLKLNAESLGLDANRIVAVGGSAGGHLVGLMATGSDSPALQPIGSVSKYNDATKQEYASKLPDSRLQAAIVMAGPMRIASGSVAERSQPGKVSNAINWIGNSIDQLPSQYHLADAHEKISSDDPPILFLTGSLDSPERDQPSLEALRSAGVKARQVIHDGAKHGHWNRQEWMDIVVKDILTFLSETK